MAIFPSALGWIAMLGRGQVLLELTFGHPSADDALAALRARGEGGQTASLDITSADITSADITSADIASMEWNGDLAGRLQAYAQGQADDFLDVPLDLAELSAFQRRVIEHCRRIPRGRTCTYGELAALSGSPRAARAVGSVMSGNRTPLVVPCHRVVAAGGKLGQYSAAGGRRMKLRLLEAER
jgi:methylated-DNA-[protein]-cysteine S-methyltransferase